MPVINTNTAANSAVRFLNENAVRASGSVAKLSSGQRIVRASDDAAGLGVSTKLQSDINTLKQAGANASQAASLLQVADGGLARITDTLQRLKSLAAQSLSGTISDTERSYIDAEFQQLNEEIGEIIDRTTFSGNQLINQSLGAFFVGVSVTVGTGSSGTVGGDVIEIDLSGATGVVAEIAGSGSGGAGVDTVVNAARAMVAIDTQLERVSSQRSTVGALISRFDTRGRNIATTVENTQAANSVIADVDIAKEQTAMVSANVRVQAAVAALSQANQRPQQLLRLLN